MATRVPEEKRFIINHLRSMRPFQSQVKLAGRVEKLPIAEEGKPGEDVKNGLVNLPDQRRARSAWIRSEVAGWLDRKPPPVSPFWRSSQERVLIMVCFE